MTQITEPPSAKGMARSRRGASLGVLAIVLVIAAAAVTFVAVRGSGGGQTACQKWDAALRSAYQTNVGLVGPGMAKEFRAEAVRLGWLDVHAGTIMRKPANCS